MTRISLILSVRGKQYNVILLRNYQITIVKLLFRESEFLKWKSADKIQGECDLCLYYWFLSFFYDEIFDVQKKRVQEASGYLVGFSETAPHILRAVRGK